MLSFGSLPISNTHLWDENNPSFFTKLSDSIGIDTLISSFRGNHTAILSKTFFFAQFLDCLPRKSNKISS